MHLNSIFIKNFRCFVQKKIEFNAGSILIIGPNGSGKTSILEAIYYSNHLKSFKNTIPTDLIYIDGNPNNALGFNLELNFDLERISIGFWDKKRSIKLNDKNAKSHKDIYSIFKVLAITADDIFLIQGAPELKRNFLDQTAIMLDLNYAQILKDYKIVLQNRNALLQNWNNCLDSYNIWSEKLYILSTKIREIRKSILESLYLELNALSSDLELDLKIELHYVDTCLSDYKSLMRQELIRKRTLFGAHLDDVEIFLNGKNAKLFGSRGQQKLLVFLLKLSQMQVINRITNNSSLQIFLIDDFVSDLDNAKLEKLILIAQKLAHQVFITHPTDSGFIVDFLKNLSAQIYYLN